MNYELAKKLKDAGFPQSRVDRHGLPTYRETELDSNGNEEEVIFPTFSELIEACEACNKQDIHLYTTKRTLLFQKVSHKNKWHAGLTSESYIGLGETPEEAVATLWLWLKLNAKNEH